ncbi:MAG: undecaprenyl/decaprenyl-phosphate alpha-N-acetylglucosaminyl 1-phosphate transferase [Burkholderiales bacterium]|nr:undecaprenyl/decaprenyl-phosphate alpha-N-acetylglucosaminyl 1-phosphate transferase [Burkholderiales bacterium]
MRFFILPLVLSTLITFVVMRLFDVSRLWQRHASPAHPQALHHAPTPRIGSIGIGLAALAGWLQVHVGLQSSHGPITWVTLGVMLAASVGLVEDLSNRVSVGMRLVVVALAACAVIPAEGLLLQRTDMPWLDALLAWSPALAIALTVFTITGITNAFNIIDGLNGLASACAMIILVGLGYAGYLVNDLWLAAMAVVAIGAIAGFFVWNFPGGFIFLGDGGAYLCGFVVATLSLLLIGRNPGEISPLYPLLLCIYPVAETIFSIYRRGLKRRPVSKPDRGHLHSLLFRRIDARLTRRLGLRQRRNSGTAPYLWALCLGSAVPAVMFYQHFWALAVSIVVFVLIYLDLYRRIVQFKTPRWL